MDITINAYKKCEFGYEPYPYFKEAGWEALSDAYIVSDDEFLSSDNWESYIDSIKKVYDDYGFKCSQAHLPYYEILLDSSIIKPETEEIIKRGIARAASLGAKWGVLHLRTATDHNSNVEIAYKHNKEFILRLLDTAHKYNVGIAIENLPYFKGESFNLFGTNYHDLIRLADEINDPLLGICYDFGHGILCGDDIPKAIKEIGHRLKATHIHNNFNLNHDTHISPATGVMNWKAAAKALAEIGYDNSLSIEVVYPEEEAFATSYFKHLKECAEIIMDMVKKGKTN